MRFVDTNVLLYAVGTAPADAAKCGVARALLAEHDLVLSVQVLQEFFVQSTRATRSDRLPREDALALIASWRRYRVVEQTLPLLDAGLRASVRWQLSLWDAMIVEAARAGECRVLLSEDLQHGQDFGGVRVLNPFQ
jgi:predicted nucleic acid-binding protein